MVAINDDIIQLVLDLLYWNDDGSVNRPDLASASRIARQWQRPAQARLFHTVNIVTRSKLVAFGRSTGSRRGSQLRSLVLELNFTISGHTAVMGVAPSRSLMERDLISLLPNLPNLYQLRINALAPSISRNAQKSLSSSQMPKIKSLIVDYRGNPPDRSHQVFFDFLGAIPTIDRAMFVGKGTYMWPSFRRGEKPEPPKVALKELRVDSLHSQPAMKGSDLAWLVSHSLRSLEILHLYDLILEPSMANFISSLEDRLLSFHVSSSRTSDLAELPAWVRRMTKLRELVIRNDILSAECFRVIIDLPRLMEALPPTIRHLGFAVDNQQGLAIVQPQVEIWCHRHQVKLSILTLVLSRRLEFNDEVTTPCIGRLRVFRYSDPDIQFAFVSRLKRE